MILDLFRTEVEFKNIQGYDDIKDIVRSIKKNPQLSSHCSLCPKSRIINHEYER